MQLTALFFIALLIFAFIDYFIIIYKGFKVSLFWGIILLLSFFIWPLFIAFYIFSRKHWDLIRINFIRMHVTMLIAGVGVIYMLMDGYASYSTLM